MWRQWKRWRAIRRLEREQWDAVARMFDALEESMNIEREPNGPVDQAERRVADARNDLDRVRRELDQLRGTA